MISGTAPLAEAEKLAFAEDENAGGPELIDGAVIPTRRRDDPFTLILHEHPDLDCVASAYLASAYLTTGSFPGAAEALGRYVDKVDEGALGLTLANPFGPVVRGWAAVERTVDRAAANYAGGRVSGFEEVSRYETPVGSLVALRLHDRSGGGAGRYSVAPASHPSFPDRRGRGGSRKPD